MINYKRHRYFYYLSDFIRNLFFLREIFSIISILRAKYCFITGNYFSFVKNLGWVLRNSHVDLFRKISLKQIFLLTNEIKKNKNNPILQQYLNSNEYKKICSKYQALPSEEIKSLQGNLRVLREYNAHSNEPGIIVLQYTDRFKEIFVLFPPEELFSKYYIVLEPSWFGYCDADILIFINNIRHVIVESPVDTDFDFIESLSSNLKPVRLGASHWVDLNIFKPLPDVKKEYDLIYIANWALYKRHFVLFKALRKLMNEGYRLKILLIGFSWSNEIRKKEDIEKEIRTFGISELVTVREWMPAEKVNEYLNKSRMSVLLSKREGTCRITAESIAAGIPMIVYKHNEGGSINFINHKTGVASSDKDIPETILSFLSNKTDQLDPRSWAEKNIGVENAISVINNAIKDIGQSKGY